MGKVMSVAARKVKRFNVENRAHKFLDREKISPAPKYESNIRDYQKVLEGIFPGYLAPMVDIIK